MKILVCISKTPDTVSKIAFKEDDTVFDTDGVQYIMNPYDEWYALVKALELKESGGGSVTVIHVGPADNETIIRKALAIGADDAIRVDTEARDALQVAAQVTAAVKSGGYDLVLTGKETIEYNSAEVGAMVAEMLQWPFVSYAVAMDVTDGSALVTRDIEGGEETAEVPLPLVASAAKGLAEQRIPNMRGIMMAKRKPLNVVEAVPTDGQVKITKYTLPSSRSSCRYVDPEDMDQLVELLNSEAKVI